MWLTDKFGKFNFKETSRFLIKTRDTPTTGSPDLSAEGKEFIS